MAEFDQQSESGDCSSKCNTCRAIFSCFEKLKDHYRSDWHIVNSKRRSNNLPPLMKSEFKKAVATKLIQLQPSKTSLPSPSRAPQAPPQPTPPIQVNKESPEEEENGEGEGEEEGEAVEEEKSEPLQKVATNVSIFDSREFETTDECVDYMAVTYGFFIPDVEYLVDRDNLLLYLGGKVKVGATCLYCQKVFKNASSCQNHMKSKSHCKIAYEDGVDLEDFEDFYDFTASYEDGPGNEDEDLDEEGNPVEKTAELTAIGELVLPDGRTVGHRAFRKYYKQNFRPVDDRPAVLAQQREELLRLGAVRYGSEVMSPEEIDALSDMQVMTLLTQHQKEIRKGQIIEQRGRMKRDFIDQRREFQSTKDHLRASVNTTAKIRDYHSLIM